jgi:endo-1,4-beta-xylanase
MKSRGIPIDGVGLQYHVSTQSFPQYNKINDLIGRYCQLGLEVHITEMDVKSGGNAQAQAKIYSEALKACLSNSCCTAFLVWGVGDNDSWLGANEAGLLFDGSYQPKAAYTSLLETLGGGRAGGNAPAPSPAPAGNNQQPPANNQPQQPPAGNNQQPPANNNPWGGNQQQPQQPQANNNPWGGNQQQPQQPPANNNPWGGNQQQPQWNQWGGNQQGNNAAAPAGGNGGNCAGAWAQCGGQGFNGPKCCSQGTCKVINEYYSQCAL